jgi:uncharacterized protein YndB with AHSA1/START domain
VNPSAPFVVKVTRRLDQSPERVFDAWLDPDTVRKWFAPELGPMTRVQIEARVGGKFSIMQKRAGIDVDHVGEYVEVDRPRRLVFTWALPQYSDDVSKVIIEIEKDGKGSRLTLTHEMDPKWAGFAKQTEMGWTHLLEGISKAA